MSRFGPELDVTDGLIMWLDNDPAAFDLREGQYVERWKDKSGQGNDVYQGTATEQPLLTGGGVHLQNTGQWLYMSLLFDARDNFSFSTSFNAITGYSNLANFLVLLSNYYNTGWQLALNPGGNRVYFGYRGAGVVTETSLISDVWLLGSTHTITLSVNWQTGPQIYWDGQNITSSTATPTDLSDFTDQQPLIFNRPSDYNASFTEPVVESRLYNRALSAEEVQILASRHTTPEGGPQMKQDNLIISTGDVKTKVGQSEWLYNDGKGRSMDQAKERHSQSMSNVERFEKRTGNKVLEAYGAISLTEAYGSEGAEPVAQGGLSQPLLRVQRASDNAELDVGVKHGRWDQAAVEAFADSYTVTGMFNQVTGTLVPASGEPESFSIDVGLGAETVLVGNGALQSGTSIIGAEGVFVTEAPATETGDLRRGVHPSRKRQKASTRTDTSELHVPRIRNSELPWTPANLGSDLVLWLDAADESTLQLRDGQYVEQWSDKSGQGNHVYQDTATEQPTWNTDNVSFDERDHLFTSWDYGNVSSIFLVSLKSGLSISRINNTDHLRGISNRLASDEMRGFDYGSSFDDIRVPNEDTPMMNALVHTDPWTYEVNGDGRTTGTDIQSSNLDTIGIGALLREGGHDSTYAGDIHLAVVTKTAVSQAQSEKLFGWAAHKYGLAHKLPNDHPYKDNAPQETVDLTVSSTRNTETLWTPANLGSDLSLWLDASDESTLQLRDGQYVEQWSDKSGQENHAVQGTATEQPNYIASSSRLDFNGNNYLDIETFGGISQPNTVFFVYEPYTIDNSLRLLDVHGSTGSDVHVLDAGSNQENYRIWSGNALSTHFTAVLERTIIGGIYNGSESAVLHNGEIVTGDAGTNTMGQDLQIGGGTRLDRYSIAAYHHVLIYDKKLTADERQKTEGYLAHKYDLAHKLPTDHPYKNNPPTE